jgi:hypothetical protein
MPAPDDRRDSGASVDDAIFAPVKVRSARRPRLLAAVVVGALGSIIGIGALDRPPASAPEIAVVASLGPSATDAAVVVRASRPSPGATHASGPVPPARPAGPLLLNITPVGSHLWVHGDVHSLAVARVLVSVEDPAGNVAATASVRIPGGSPAQRLDPTPAFNVHFSIPDEIQADGFIVSATASNAAGATLFTITKVMAASTRPF